MRQFVSGSIYQVGEGEAVSRQQGQIMRNRGVAWFMPGEERLIHRNDDAARDVALLETGKYAVDLVQVLHLDRDLDETRLGDVQGVSQILAAPGDRSADSDAVSDRRGDLYGNLIRRHTNQNARPPSPEHTEGLYIGRCAG